MSSSFDQLDLMSAPGDGGIDFDQLVVSMQRQQSQSTNDQMDLDNSEILVVGHSPGARHSQVAFQALRPILPVGGTLTLASNSKPKRNRKSVKNIPGNNKSGRKGVPGCEQCRKRRWKCIYDVNDPESTCQFCRDRNISEPCVKIWGPKRQSQVFPSRALTRYDLSMDPKDVPLLQLACSAEYIRLGGSSELSLFFRAMIFAYGSSIDHVGLRHGILACVSKQIGQGSSVQHLEHIILATQALGRKLANPSTLDEEDLFLSCLIALSTVEPTNDPNLSGFMAVMRHLNDRVGGALEKYHYTLFWSLARDTLGFYLAQGFGTARDFWWASGLLLGPPNLETVLSYQSAFTKDLNFSVSFLRVRTLIFQNLEFRELVRFITRQSPNSRYSSLSNSFVGSICDDRLFTEHQRRILETVEWDLSIDLEFAASVFKASGDLSSNLSINFGWSYSVLWVRLNRLLRVLLQAPSVIEGLISHEGLETGASVVECLRGGSCFLLLHELESPEDYLDSLTHLISGTGKKFLDGSPWSLFTKTMEREESVSRLRDLWEEDADALIDMLFFRFPTFDVEWYTIEEVFEYIRESSENDTRIQGGEDGEWIA